MNLVSAAAVFIGLVAFTGIVNAEQNGNRVQWRDGWPVYPSNRLCVTGCDENGNEIALPASQQRCGWVREISFNFVRPQEGQRCPQGGGWVWDVGFQNYIYVCEARTERMVHRCR